MTSDHGEVAVRRGGHVDVIETPGLEARITIDADDAGTTIRAPPEVGIVYEDEPDDELELPLAGDGGELPEESRFRTAGWSPTVFQTKAAMWIGGLLLIGGGLGLASMNSDANTAGFLALLGRIGLQWAGYLAASGRTA